MSNINSFQPIANQNSKILILGSMPGDISLQKQQYYAHQRNAFWQIMSRCFNEEIEVTDYGQRKSLLINNQVAVWDVLQSCHRPGSLDASIQMDSIKVNDFQVFFSAHQQINRVCFNGAKAESIYNRHVLPEINKHFGHIHYAKLPSTSPAYAAMTLDNKAQAWLKVLKENPH